MKIKKQFSFKACDRHFLTMVAVLLTLSGVSAFAQNDKPDFSGTWAFNESKSTAAEGGFRMAPILMTITQDATTLTVERTSKGQNGEELKSTSKFTLDGKECSNTLFGNNIRKSIVTWSADGKVLNFAHTMNFERDGQSTEFKSTDAWTLNAADKTLSVATSFNGPQGEMKVTNVYDKK
jgi:hypothetical protein